MVVGGCILFSYYSEMDVRDLTYMKGNCEEPGEKDRLNKEGWKRITEREKMFNVHMGSISHF